MRIKKSRFEPFAIAYIFFGLMISSTAFAGSTDTGSPTDRQVVLLEKNAAQSPDSIQVRNRLARTYIQKARENGDASFFTLAESLLTNNLEKEPANSEAIGLRAWVSLFKHEFKDAARWAEKGLSQSPKSSFYYGLLSDAHLEMGNYDEAVGYAQKMVDLRPDQGSYSRAAYLRSIFGDSTGAVTLWQLAIRSGAPDAENTAWCQVELGDEYFNRGKLAKAEEAYQASLTTFPEYHRGLAGMGKVRAAQKQWDESAEFYRRAAGVVPYPQYIGALGDVYTEMQKSDEAQKQFDLVEYIAKINRVNQVLYNRDLALFYADHNTNLDEALRLARKELEVRRDIYTYDILAWAYFQNKRYPEAERAIGQAMKLGTRDARIFYHAGMIASALGNRKTARNYLTQALSINPYFPYRNRAEAVLKGIGS
jgi:tetratricopeptide (TPR) repeat protein